MPDSQKRLEDLLNRIAGLLPLVEKSDLTTLSQIHGLFSEITTLKGLPVALGNMVKRAASLTEHVILEESPFESGIEKLGECVEKLQRAVGDATLTEEKAPAAHSDQSSGTTPASGPMDRENRDLLVKFASQQRPVLEDFEACVLDLEKGIEQARNAIKRILHTWKGEFGVLDMRDYAALIHTVEERLEEDTISTDELLQLNDFLGNRIDLFCEGRSPGLSETEKSQFGGEESRAFSSSNEASGPEKETVPQEEPAQEPSLEKETPRDAVPTSGERAFDGDPTLMGDFITESNDHIHSAESILLELENDPVNPEYLNSIFRSCHTIKGVAGFLGLTEVSNLSHSMENLMDLARKGELLLGSAHIDLLLESMDCLRELVAIVEATLAGESFHLPQTYHSIIERLASPHAIAQETTQAVAPNTRLGEILVEKGVVDREDLGEALRLQKDGDERRLGEILMKAQKVKARTVAGALASQNAARKPKTVDETIRVPVERLDQLIDAIGEAVIAQSMVAADQAITSISDQRLERKITQTNLIMRQIQELSMSLRMVSIKSTFQKMARLVRDLAKKSGKEVDFVMEGEDTELDKSVVENIGDPLIHMVRNSVDHGIETDTGEREAAGKPAKARVCLRAFHKAGSIFIEIQDDGRGLDRDAILAKAVAQGLCKENDRLSDQEVFQFIFAPGFSTAKKVTDVSGRGVGMDVVRRNIQSLRGSVEIASERGKGTTFSVRLPLTLAIIDGMITRLGSDTYIVPTLSIVESLAPRNGQIETVMQRGEMLKVRGELIPFIRLDGLFGSNGHVSESTKGIAVIVEDMLGKKVALFIDELLGQQQVVIKNLGQGMGDVPGISGGAIMSDGNVSLILDIGGIVKMACEKAG